MVTVAQLVEPRIVIPVVVGSNPISHPNLFFLFRIRALNIFGNSHDVLYNAAKFNDKTPDYYV